MKSLARAFRWLTNRTRKSVPPVAQPAPTFKPQSEQLEDRIVPAWTINDLTTITATAMAQNLVGPGVTVSNVVYTGANAAAGTFNDTTNATGIKAGVVLSSGSAKGLAGPNTSSSFTLANNTPSDATLDTLIAPTPGHDAAVLEFDFKPKGTLILFTYVFGSDEYPEYAPPPVQPYNDTFAFFLNGINVTTLPGTTIPVSIGNVNASTNSNFYVNNDFHPVAPKDTQMDGFTKVLTVPLIVKKGVTNHIKIAIQDAFDMFYDSWVMIKAGSLVANASAVTSYAPLRYTYNASTRLYSGVFTVMNTSIVPIQGPLYFVFNGLPAGVTVANATGKTPSGKPYITVPGSVLSPGTQVKITVNFSNPLKKNLGTFFLHGPTDLTNALT